MPCGDELIPWFECMESNNDEFACRKRIMILGIVFAVRDLMKFDGGGVHE